MIIGHLGVSYILSQAPNLFGNPVSIPEQLAIVVSGYILDWDIILPLKKGGANHHYLPTHTPFFAAILYTGIYLILKGFFQPATLILIGLSMFLHLVFDDVSYWLYRFGISKKKTERQIIWLYPLVQRKKEEIENATGKKLPIITAIRKYFSNPFFVKMEAIVVLIAFGFFIVNVVRWSKNNAFWLTQIRQNSTIQTGQF